MTSHYGFLLVDYYLLPGLTGQVTDIPGGTLSFEPAYACPYTLPVLLMGTEGLLVCDSLAGDTQYTLALLFGSLVLPPGGLSVSNSHYAQAVNLVGGANVSWTLPHAA